MLTQQKKQQQHLLYDLVPQQQVKISEGQTALVNKVNSKDGTELALKIYKSEKYDKKFHLHETSILKQLNHENIIRYYDSDNFLILFEYAKNGEFFDYIKTARLPETLARFYFHQLLDAVEHCNSQNIYHRDLKLENILLDEKFDLKLADFGLATQLRSNTDKCNDFVGTMNYIAPEMHERKPYSPEVSDIFSLGVVLFLFVVGCQPFLKSCGSDQLYNLILQGKQTQYWKSYQQLTGITISQEFQDLINKMFEPDPSKRITIKEIKEHWWFNQDVMQKQQVMSIMQTIQQQIQKV